MLWWRQHSWAALAAMLISGFGCEGTQRQYHGGVSALVRDAGPGTTLDLSIPEAAPDPRESGSAPSSKIPRSPSRNDTSSNASNAAAAPVPEVLATEDAGVPDAAIAPPGIE